jgi:hypothetical protein
VETRKCWKETASLKKRSWTQAENNVSLYTVFSKWTQILAHLINHSIKKERNLEGIKTNPERNGVSFSSFIFDFQIYT